MIEFPVDTRFQAVVLPEDVAGVIPLYVSPGQYRKPSLADLRDYIAEYTAVSYLLRKAYPYQMVEEDIDMYVNALDGYSRFIPVYISGSTIRLLAGSKCVGLGGVYIELVDNVDISSANLDTGTLEADKAYTLYVGLDNQDSVIFVLSLASSPPGYMFSGVPVAVFRTWLNGAAVEFLRFDFQAGLMVYNHGGYIADNGSTVEQTLQLPGITDGWFPALVDWHGNNYAVYGMGTIPCSAVGSANNGYNSGVLSYLDGGTIYHIMSSGSGTLYFRHMSTDIWRR